MNYDHYELVRSKFPNVQTLANREVVEQINVSGISVEQYEHYNWVIDNSDWQFFLFYYIESRVIADEIFQYIKETEILFV